MPARPAAGRGPRSAASSSARTARDQASRSIPAQHSGCLSSDSSGTGANSAATHSASRRRNAPAGTPSSGRPALSSATRPWRGSSAATRHASSRSGVTSATLGPVRPRACATSPRACIGGADASRQPRMASAMPAASACASGACITNSPSSAALQPPGCCRVQGASAWCGSSAVPSSSARGEASRPSVPVQGRMSPRAAPSWRSRRRWPAKGCVQAVAITSSGMAAEAASSCGRTTAPSGRPRAIRRSSSAAAGMVPPAPIPAAITAPLGGRASHSRRWTRSARTRRRPMSSNSRSRSQVCQPSATARRKPVVMRQCSARSSGARRSRRASHRSA